MSPIIEAMKPSPNLDRQSCASLGELFPKNGTAFATESPTTFVSSRPTIFGSSRRPGISEKNALARATWYRHNPAESRISYKTSVPRSTIGSTRTKLHGKIVNLRNGREIRAIIQVLTPSATCRAIRRHLDFSALASERRAVRSMASSLSTCSRLALRRRRRARAPRPARRSAPRMRHNSDEAEQPPNPSGWCSLVMNMSAASQRQTTTCGECATSLTILRFSRWSIHSRLNRREGLTTGRTLEKVVMWLFLVGFPPRVQLLLLP